MILTREGGVRPVLLLSPPWQAATIMIIRLAAITAIRVQSSPPPQAEHLKEADDFESHPSFD